MNRSVSVRAGVAAALVLALLAGSFNPVGAANVSMQSDGLVVGSSHDTQSEFQDAQTLANLTTTSSGDGAVELTSGKTTLDGFEDGDASEWSQESGSTLIAAQQSIVADGSYAGNQSSGGSYQRSIRDTNGVDLRGKTTAFDARFSDTSANHDIFLGADTSGTPIAGLRVTNGELRVWNSTTSSFEATGQSISTGQWYNVELRLNRTSDTYDVVLDGSVVAADVDYDDSSSLNYIYVASAQDSTYFDSWNYSADADSARYVSALHNVTDAEEAAINITAYSNVSVTAVVQTDGGTVLNESTLSGTGNHTLTLASTSSENLETILDVNVTGENPQFRLSDESILFTPHAPNATEVSPANNTEMTTQQTTLSVNVSDADFGTAQGDTATATFVANGEQVGTDSRSSNGTLQTTLESSGEVEWYAIIEDSYGQQIRTENRTLLSPSTLSIRPVNQPQELLNDSNVTITGRFFSGELVFERNTTDGKIDLTNLPPDRTYVLVLQADGYYRRTVIVRSLYEQSSVFLLNSSRPSYYTEFALNDLTGEFTGPNTRTQLYIERALNTSDELEWMTIGGDYLGAEGRFEIDLEQDARYRIRLVSGNSTRVLGAYTATREGAVTLTVGAVRWEVDEPETVRHRAAFYNLTDGAEEPNGLVHWQYVNPNETTSELRVVIREDGNESNTIMNSTFSSGYGTFSLNETISGNQMDTNWEVHWTAYNSSGQVIGSGTDVVTGQRITQPNPFGAKWTPVVLTCLFLFVGTMFGGRLSSVGSLVVVGVAGVMWYLGWYTASGGVVVFAGVVAVAMAIGGGARR